MISSTPLGERLRAARHTGNESLATRNRLFAALACFVLAGGGVVCAIGSRIDDRGVLPPVGPTLLFAISASLAGLIVSGIELSRGGGSRDVWFSIGFNLLALSAALLLH
jgi:hypothetical protein